MDSARTLLKSTVPPQFCVFPPPECYRFLFSFTGFFVRLVSAPFRLALLPPPLEIYRFLFSFTGIFARLVSAPPLRGYVWRSSGAQDSFALLLHWEFRRAIGNGISHFEIKRTMVGPNTYIVTKFLAAAAAAAAAAPAARLSAPRLSRPWALDSRRTSGTATSWHLTLML